MIYLHVLRHAKTEVQSALKKDFDRALIEKGELQAASVGDYFSENLPKCSTHCSTSKRTRQTIKLVEKAMKESSEKIGKITFSDELYLASKDNLLSYIWNLGITKHVLLIGHNEGLSELVSYLSGQFTNLSTGDYICLEFECENWNETSFETGKVISNFSPLRT
jgi:phosphohistidine phosphatase